VTGSRIAWLVVALAACERSEPPHVDKQPQVQRPERRVIEPPAGLVRPLPPHAIRADGVGPYRLGDKLSDVLAQLASGPRIALIEIPGVVHHSLIRTEEDDTVLIGGEPAGTATFVAVTGASVARTESGIHVGSTRKDLAPLGPPVRDPDRALDPRLVVPSGMRNARIVLDGDRVIAIAIVEPAPPPPAPGGEETCTRPEPPAGARVTVIGSCMSATGERVEVLESEISVRMGEGERAIGFKLPAPIVFAAPLRMPDGRDELAVVTRADGEQTRTWALSTFRFEAGRLARTTDAAPLYVVTAANARWIGADLRDVDLYLDLTSRKDGIEVGGLLTTRSGSAIKDLVVITSVPVARKHAKSE